MTAKQFLSTSDALVRVERAALRAHQLDHALNRASMATLLSRIKVPHRLAALPATLVPRTRIKPPLTLTTLPRRHASGHTRPADRAVPVSPTSVTHKLRQRKLVAATSAHLHCATSLSTSRRTGGVTRGVSASSRIPPPLRAASEEACDCRRGTNGQPGNDRQDVGGHAGAAGVAAGGRERRLVGVLRRSLTQAYCRELLQAESVRRPSADSGAAILHAVDRRP